jgi:hypothetical protein
VRIFKTKYFSKWASKEGLTDKSLKGAVDEVESGLVDAYLGGHLVKKRVAMPGKGKSGSTRTILAIKSGEQAFFVYGFAKNARSNISSEELKALKLIAKEMLGYRGRSLKLALSSGALVEVEIL